MALGVAGGDVVRVTLGVAGGDVVTVVLGVAGGDVVPVALGPAMRGAVTMVVAADVIVALSAVPVDPGNEDTVVQPTASRASAARAPIAALPRRTELRQVMSQPFQGLRDRRHDHLRPVTTHLEDVRGH